MRKGKWRTGPTRGRGSESVYPEIWGIEMENSLTGQTDGRTLKARKAMNYRGKFISQGRYLTGKSDFKSFRISVGVEKMLT